MSWIPRYYVSPLKKRLAQFPIVCLLGPRQCGKTSFAKHCLKDWAYFDLEKPSHRIPVESDPESFLKNHFQKIIFDEAQQLPSLFPVLRSFVDEHRKKGMFLLLGSASPHLIRGASETLAGRICFLDMAPFHILEVEQEEALWLKGGFPDAFLARTGEQRTQWFEAYTRTFIERDLSLYGVGVDPLQMRRLMTMLAHMHGGILNASELGNSLGINYHTVNHYVDILEQTFLVRRLKPYFANIGKRLVKSPKIYFRDSGLLHYFLNIPGGKDLMMHPKQGASWEGFVIEQISQWIYLNYPGTEVYFWRTATQQEADLLIKRGDQLVPVEIKRHTSPAKKDVDGLFACMNDLKLKKGFVIHPEGPSYSLGDGVEVMSLGEFLSAFSGLFS